MGKKFRKWYGIARKPLIWFLTALLVIQMFPAQGMAYAVEEAANAAIEQPAAENEVSVTSALPEGDVVVQETAAEPAPVLQASDPEPAPAEDPAPVDQQEQALAPETEPEVAEETITEEAPVVTPTAEVAIEETTAQEVVAEEAPAPEAEPEVTTPEEETVEETEVAFPAQRLTARVGDMVVNVIAPDGALPEGSQLVVTPVDSASVAGAVEAAVASEGKSVSDLVAIDVTILDASGVEVQPNIPVSVKFVNAGVEGDDISVYHIEQSGAAIPVDTNQATASVQRFDADGFSTYVVVSVDDATGVETIELSETSAAGVTVTITSTSDVLPRGTELAVTDNAISAADASTGTSKDIKSAQGITISPSPTPEGNVVTPSSPVSVPVTDLSLEGDVLAYTGDYTALDGTTSHHRQPQRLLRLRRREQRVCCHAFLSDDDTIIQTFVKNSGEAISVMPSRTPSKEGHRFDGWFVQNEDGTISDVEVTADTIVESDITAVAKFTGHQPVHRDHRALVQDSGHWRREGLRPTLLAFNSST